VAVTPTPGTACRVVGETGLIARRVFALVNCKYAGDADDTTAALPSNVHPPAVGLGTLVACLRRDDEDQGQQARNQTDSTERRTSVLANGMPGPERVSG
jgi:hypothetical protein